MTRVPSFSHFTTAVLLILFIFNPIAVFLKSKNVNNSLLNTIQCRFVHILHNKQNQV